MATLDAAVVNISEVRVPFPGRSFLGPLGTAAPSSNGCTASCKDWSVPLPWNVNHLLFTPQEISDMTLPDEEVEITTIMWSSWYWTQLRIRVGGENSFARIRPTREPCDLPLASITPNRLDLEALLRLPGKRPTPELLEFLAWITTDRAQHCVKNHPKLAATQRETRHHVSRHVLGDVPDLEAWGVLEEGKTTDLSLEIPIFKVAKAGNMDARLIGDCRPLNELLPRPGPMGLPSINDVLRQLLSKNYLYQLDAKSFFYQFAIHRSLQELLTSRCGGARGRFRTMRWIVMAMGLSFAPGVAQHTSLHIAANVVTESDECLLPWVDNFLFGTMSSPGMDSLRSRFETVRKAVNMEMKPADAEPGRTMSCVGLFLDCSSDDVMEHFATLDPAFLKNLESAIPTITDIMTPRELYRIFGALMWANHAVMGQPLARWNEALEYVRATSRELFYERLQWDRPEQVPTGAQRDLREMVAEALVAKVTLRSLMVPIPTEILWSDACSACFGYLREGEDAVYGLSRTYEGLGIYSAELLVAADCLNSAQGTPLQVVDNQGALRALVKGHSSTRAGNIILHRLWQGWGAEKQAMTCWAPSECNKVDPLSRGHGGYPSKRWAPRGPCEHCSLPTPIRWRGRA